MIEVRIYDKDFNWVDVSYLCTFIQLKRELYGIGSFEIQIPITRKEASSFCKKGNIVIINGNSEKVGIIRSYRIEENRNNAILIVNGYTSNGITKQRIIVPQNKSQNSSSLGYENISGNSESVIKYFAYKSMVNAYNSNRNIKNMIIKRDTNFGKSFSWRARYSYLSDELESICSYAEVGYKISADLANKQWVFDIIRGNDRTKNQGNISPVVFKTEYSNIGNYNYTEDYLDYKNTAYAGGYGEDENRLIYILNDENIGVDRFEVFLDCSNANNITDLMFYANQKIIDYEAKKTLVVDTLPKTFIFEKDYFLGDKVSIYINSLKLEMDTIITSVEEVWERDLGYNCKIRFGDKVPNLLSLNNRKEIVK